MVRQIRDMRQNSKTTLQFPQPPRFIEHQEITAPGSVHRLFKPSTDPPPEGRLSHEQELVLFKRMQYCGYRMSKMWDRLGQLNREEQARYIKWFKQYISIRDRLVNANLGLVFDLLGKNRFTNVDRDELRSEGLMALVRSVDTFNPWRGIRFSTYACNSIIRSFSRLGLMQSKRQHLWSSSYDVEREPVTDHHYVSDTDLVSERLQHILKQGHADLNDNEKFVLDQRFPRREGQAKATLKTVGRKMKISKERVRQIQESALAKLRRALLSDPILQ